MLETSHGLCGKVFVLSDVVRERRVGLTISGNLHTLISWKCVRLTALALPSEKHSTHVVYLGLDQRRSKSRGSQAVCTNNQCRKGGTYFARLEAVVNWIFQPSSVFEFLMDCRLSEREALPVLRFNGVNTTRVTSREGERSPVMKR